MKESHVNWIGQIPIDWSIKKLKFSAFHRTQKSKKNSSTLPYVGLENVESETGRLIDFNEEMDESDAKLFLKDDVLFGKLRPYLAKVTKMDFAGRCSGKFLVLDGKEFENDFLKFLLLSYGSIKTIDASTHGAKMPRAEWEFIGNMFFPVLKKTEQNQISNYLEQKTKKIDNEISKNQDLIKLLKESKQSVINRTVTKGLDDTVPMKDSGVPWIGDVPEQWKNTRYKFLTNRVIVGIAEGSTHAYVDDGVPLIRSTNVRPNYLRDEDLIFIDIEFAKKNFSKSLIENDILTVRTGSPGVSAIVPKELNGSQCFTLLVSTPSKSQSAKFLCYYLNSDIAKITFKNEGWGAVQINISVPILQNLPILEPPLSEQNQIAAYLDEKTKKIDFIILNSECHIQKLQEYRESLISKAVTGKIDVRYA